jgi:hypothetical protein
MRSVCMFITRVAFLIALAGAANFPVEAAPLDSCPDWQCTDCASAGGASGYCWVTPPNDACEYWGCEFVGWCSEEWLELCFCEPCPE